MGRKRLRIIAVGVAVAAAVATCAFLVDTQALLAEAQAHADEATSWVQAHPLLSPAIFLVCATLGTMTPFPGAVLIMLSGGFLFGSIGGGILSALGATLSAGLVYLAGRRSFAAVAERALARFQRGAPRSLTSGAFNYLLALRLLPGMPAWLSNLLPVPLPVPLRTVLVATSLGILPICLIVASIGNGVAMLGVEHEALSAQMILRTRYLAPLLGLAILAILPLVIRRFVPNERHAPMAHVQLACDRPVHRGSPRHEP